MTTCKSGSRLRPVAAPPTLLFLGASLFFLTGCDQRQSTPSATAAEVQPRQVRRLVILTPHNPTIERLFEDHFEQWHADRFGEDVSIQWMLKGTNECVQYLMNNLAASRLTDNVLMPDILFGGGIPVHDYLKHTGISVPYKPAPDLVKDMPASVCGLPLFDPEGYWHATAMSGFGILCNAHDCRARGVSAPTTWEDLARPEYFGWVSLGDAERSGSLVACLDMILQKHGWERGWDVILRMAANARGIAPSSATANEIVVSGFGLAGLCADFVGLSAVAARPDSLQYVTPADASALTPDPISILNSGQYRKTAERFVEFCLSEEGQRIWCLPGSQLGGPDDTLFRFPVQPSMYTKYAGQMTNSGNPFVGEGAFRIDPVRQRIHSRIVPLVLKAACADQHVQMQQAWSRVIASGAGEDVARQLTRVPISAEDAARIDGELDGDPALADKLVNEWASAFRAQYAAIIGAG